MVLAIVKLIVVLKHFPSACLRNTVEPEHINFKVRNTARLYIIDSAFHTGFARGLIRFIRSVVSYSID